MASPRLPLKRTRLDSESATTFMRQLKRAASGAHPELYSSFCDKLQAAVGAAEAANAASKPEEEGAATRRFLAEAEGLLAGLPYQGYYYALLRMLPEEQLPALNSAQDPERRAAAAGKADELCAESLVEAYDTERKAWSIAKVRQVQPDAISHDEAISGFTRWAAVSWCRPAPARPPRLLERGHLTRHLDSSSVGTSLAAKH